MTQTIPPMPRYESYKDSGFEPIGDIPEHWEVKKFKYLANVKKGRLPAKIVSENNNDLLPYLTMDYLRGGIANQFVDDNNALVVNEGELLLLWDGSNSGEFIKSRKGVVSSTLATVNFYSLNKRFSWYACQITERVLRGGTIGMGIPHVSGEELKNSLLAIPSEEEQQAIADFLDKKTGQIDKAIEIKEKQIALLKEYKQIIIQNAVTKGLNPNAPMKNSGIDWIGDIPEHWEVVKLGAILKPISQKNKADLPLLSITREQGVIVRDVGDQESNHNFIPDDLSGYKVIQKGQFGMNKMKAWQGSYGVSDYTGIVSPAYFVYDFTWNIFPAFFHKSIRCLTYITFFASASDGVRIGQWDLSKTRMKNIPFVIPAQNEQKEIVTYIENKTNEIKTAIDLLNQQISKLKEYKASLINSAVTGKIKVI